MNDTWSKNIKVVIGSVIFTLGVYFFITPCGLNSGGIFGLAQILNSVLKPMLGLSMDLTGICNLALNIPLYLLALRSISKSFCVRTLVSILIQMALLSILPVRYTIIMNDLLSNCVFGALMCGVGVGLCLQSSGCTGGVDILGVYFSKTKPNFSVGKLSILLNVFVFTLFACMNSITSAMYSIIFVALMYTIADKVHYQNINILALIVTKDQTLKDQIMSRTGRGVTFWNGHGAYTGNEKEILMVALNKYETRRLEKVVKEVDPNAFLIINEGQKIRGGFEKRL